MYLKPLKRISVFLRQTFVLACFALAFLPMICSATEVTRQAYEEKVASNIQNVLESIVGEGKVKVTVHADMNTSVMKVNEKVLESENPILKNKKETEDSIEEEYIYASKDVEHVEHNENVRNLAVVVVATRKAFQQLNTPEVYQLIERISGFSSERGDTIDMAPTLEDLGKKSFPIYGLWPVALCLLGMIVWKLSKQKKNVTIKPTVPDFARSEVLDEFLPENENLLKRTRRFLDEEPEEALSALRQWMNQKGEAHE